jgi:hypothetical protein
MGGSQDAECRPLAEKARALVVRLHIPNIERAPSRAAIPGGLKPTQTNAGCAKFCFFAAAHRNLLHAGLAFRDVFRSARWNRVVGHRLSVWEHST